MTNNAMIGGTGGQTAVNNNIQNVPAAAASPSSSHWYPVSMMDTTVFDAGAQRMPLNLSEPVIWSSQFVNAQYNPFFGNATAELEDL
ncbi:uncharacterized protein A1O5_12229 [Cladophialophora psammophila CBS 110553]|uniref:Uncharacterized protein n=1 Tax=Cladophialophora psammophila CBS 110553 TaxID=1182543 RepID=W9VUX1_9EURO|nr:uncharacterized protein A1O5_12229 [Cladophialophora psammophila CBS 110553]EXJ59348.1 hypothetical protein A1O5_12229 [Cladophialophora psammophila CBS 110553]